MVFDTDTGSTIGTVAITLIVIAVIAMIVCVVTGSLATYCIMKKRTSIQTQHNPGGGTTSGPLMKKSLNQISPKRRLRRKRMLLMDLSSIKTPLYIVGLFYAQIVCYYT